MYEEKKSRVVSLLELEEVIEPKVVHNAVHASVAVLHDSLKNNIGRVLDVVRSQDHTNINIIIHNLERKKTEENGSQIDGVINAVNGLTQLLVGDHPIILERMEARRNWGYDEKNRKDGTPLNTWVAEEANKVMGNLQTNVFLKPQPSVSATGSAPIVGDRSHSIDF